MLCHPSLIATAVPSPQDQTSPIRPSTLFSPYLSSFGSEYQFAQWCVSAVSPLYPTSFILPMISPTVKKPNTSARTTAPEANCALLMLRIWLRMVEGLALPEFDPWGKRLLGFRTPLIKVWKYDWKVERGGGVIFWPWKTSFDSSRPTRA